MRAIANPAVSLKLTVVDAPYVIARKPGIDKMRPDLMPEGKVLATRIVSSYLSLLYGVARTRVFHLDTIKLADGK